jgi:ATP-binding cassette, subfamily B, bacterial HlyB/CyaB
MNQGKHQVQKVSDFTKLSYSQSILDQKDITTGDDLDSSMARLSMILGHHSSEWMQHFSQSFLSLGDNLYISESVEDGDDLVLHDRLCWICEGGLRILTENHDRSTEVSIAHVTSGMFFIPIQTLVDCQTDSQEKAKLTEISQDFVKYRVIASSDTVITSIDLKTLQALLPKSPELFDLLLSQWDNWQAKLKLKSSPRSPQALGRLSSNFRDRHSTRPLKLEPGSRQSKQSKTHSSAPRSDAPSSKRLANRVEFPNLRRSKRRSAWAGRPLIEQQSLSDCGPTCLAMITQYWGKRYTLPQLRELCHVGRSGAQLQHLAKAAESIGFQARPVRASWSYLVKVRSPWIAHWDGEHYVVVYPTRGNKVWVADPAGGKQKITQREFQAHWSGFALLLEPTAEFQQQQPDKSKSLGRFAGLLVGESTLLMQIIGITLLAQVFGLVAPMFTQIILDQVVVQKSLNALHIFSIGALMFGIWRVGLMSIRQYLLDYFANRLDLTLMSGFMRHTLKLPLKFFEDRHVGDILTRIQENSKIQQFLVRQAVSVWLDAAMAIVYIGLMFYYNAQLAILVICMIPPFAILTLIATPFMKRVSRSMFKAESEENSLSVEIMNGISTIKSTASEQDLRWRWEEKLVNLLNQRFKYQNLANHVNLAGGMIQTIASTALLWYGASLVIQNQLTIGQFVAFNMLIGNVISPMLAVIGVWDEFQEVLIAIERLNDIFETRPEDLRVTKKSSRFASNSSNSENRLLESSDSVPVSQVVMPMIQGEVRFDRVVFAYDGLEDAPTLSNLSFKVSPGQTVAIVGRSGSGKSTLVKLLQGLYLPTQGRIIIDGYATDQIAPQSLRSQLGIVPQDCFLFSGSVAENIQLYRPDYTIEDITNAAKLAEAHTFIQELPLGYQTKVGERGANLSGGQRQRVAIARALLGDPAMLILDEATSALDTESERRFQQNLSRISRDRTTFIIAHRLSTVQGADLILVLDRGLLVEQGNHQELMAQRGLYFHLAQQQLVG